MSETRDGIGPDPSLLLVDDDTVFVERLAKAMEKRGFQTRTAASVAAARAGDGHGTGLAGLRERLALLGGSLGTQQLPGDRFALSVRLPLARPVAGATRARERVP